MICFNYQNASSETTGIRILAANHDRILRHVGNFKKLPGLRDLQEAAETAINKATKSAATGAVIDARHCPE